MEPMAHEGERIRALLLSAGKTPADLARAAKVSRTAVDRWLKADKIGKHAWLTARPGLKKLHIEPSRVKPEDPVSESEEEVDLRPLVHDFTKDQLGRIKFILDQDPLPREKLAYWIDGTLNPRK